MGWSSTLRALKYRNYRLFFFGQTISLVGTWMQQVAMGWLVYSLTHRSTLLGTVAFASQIPAFLVAPLAGVLTDRWNRQRTLLFTQSAALAQAAVLALLTWSGAIRVWHILGLSVVLGTVNALDMPTRQAFLIDMIENKEDLGNAIALNSSMFNAARLVGPAVAGLLIGWVGEWLCFSLNAVSYVAVLWALLAMKVRPKPPRPHPGLRQGLRDGFVYAFGFRPIRAILLLLALTSLAGAPLMVLMPVFAAKVFHGDARTLGYLTTASGIGALAGAVHLASRRTVLGLGRKAGLMALLCGGGLTVFALADRMLLAMPILLVVGYATMTQMAASNTILQTIVEEDKRGRVMSLYTMAFLGMAPLGSLLGGRLADAIGAPRTVAAMGAVCVAGGLIFTLRLPGLRASVRPIYVKAGILPSNPPELPAATAIEMPPQETAED